MYWTTGMNQFSHLLKTRDDFRFYDTNRPYSNFIFSPGGGGMQNFLFKGAFSRNLKNNASFSITLDRIIREGSYDAQALKSTNLSFGFRKKHKNLDFFFTGVFNAHNEESNGGIQDTTVFNSAFSSNRNTLSTKIDGANTRQADSDIALNTFFHLSKEENAQLSLRHELAYLTGGYKYSDPYIASAFDDDSTFYNPNWIDLGGRVFIQTNMLTNGIYGNFKSNNWLSATAGLKHISRNINLEITSKNYQEIYFEGNASLSILDRLDVHFNTELGFADVNENYLFEADANLSLLKNLSLQGGLSREQMRVQEVFQQAYFSTQEIWNNDFNKPIQNEIWVGLKAFKDVDIKAKFISLENALYFDWQALPAQESETLTAFQLLIDGKINLGKFHIDNEIAFQAWSKDIYQLPRIVSEHDIYLETRLFKKKMLARFGVDVRFADDFYPLDYKPAFGIFHQQNAFESKMYLMADPYISFMIDQFRAFFKYEKVNAFFLEEIQYLTKDYPQFDPVLRIGIGWQLAD